MAVGRVFSADKMSPLSDTTGIAASTVGVDLFEHIKNMSYTTIPALLLTAAALVWAVPDVVSGSLNSVQKLSGELQASGLVHGYALLPFAVLVVLALFKGGRDFNHACHHRRFHRHYLHPHAALGGATGWLAVCRL